LNTKGLNKISAWDEPAAIHILSRTLFGYNLADIEFALSISLDDFIDNYLLADKPEPPQPGFWVNDTSSENSTERTRELTYWWMNQMLTQGYSFRERMVLFWHNHFVSDYVKVGLPQRMYWQNKLFREYAFGNFKELTKKVTLDPAMLIYLDGVKNTKNSPNENYARELMELFTLGIGNYAETDIQEAARALTGWRVDGITPYFTESRFDSGEKNFLGQSGNFNHNDIVDIIFTKEEASKFLCRELYSEFIYFTPDENFISQLAQTLRDNNYNIKPVLSALLKSTYFHSDEIRGSKIKNPVEFVLSTVRQLNIQNPDYSYLRQVINQLKQELLYPPNVSGWPGDKTWISTTTLPARNIFTDSVINGKKPNGEKLSFSINVIDFARSFPAPENATRLVNDIIKCMIQFPLSDTKRKLLLDTLLDGAAVYDWSTYEDNAEARLQSFLKVLMRLSEYQLS
jgi:uncharacterized protein (DUF1800 family)